MIDRPTGTSPRSSLVTVPSFFKPRRIPSRLIMHKN